MTFALFGLLSVAVCWKWGDWRHWEKYYPTILFIMIGDAVVDYLMYSKQLWGYGDFVEQYPFLDTALMLLIYPSTIILYLTWFPSKVGKQLLYILLWVGIYTMMELISFFTGSFTYYHGWNIFYSILFNACMFPLLALHYRKPLAVWPISFALCFLILWWFRIPLSK